MGNKEILEQQLQRVKDLQKSNDNFVYNIDWEKVNENITAILIGINPGKTEKKENVFFAGTTREIIDLIKENIGYENAILTMNISNYFTSNKKAFKEVYGSESDTIKEDIKANAQLINEIFKHANEVNIYCFCKDLENEDFGKFFINELNIEVKAKVYILKHPSHGHLSDSVLKYILKNKEFHSIEDVLHKIGKKI